jgi:hypothetical protein
MVHDPTWTFQAVDAKTVVCYRIQSHYGPVLTIPESMELAEDDAPEFMTTVPSTARVVFYPSDADPRIPAQWDPHALATPDACTHISTALHCTLRTPMVQSVDHIDPAVARAWATVAPRRSA